MNAEDLSPEARHRISQAVTSGEAVRDAAEAAAAVDLARLAQRRLRARMLANAAGVSAGTTLVWVLVVAVPVSLGTGLHRAALASGLGVGLLLFCAILLLGQRQLRLARRAERRNQRLLDSGGLDRT